MCCSHPGRSSLPADHMLRSTSQMIMGCLGASCQKYTSQQLTDPALSFCKSFSTSFHRSRHLPRWNGAPYEPAGSGLYSTGHFAETHPLKFFTHFFIIIMAPKAPFTPLLDNWHYKKGFEIPTKHKEIIYQLYWFGKVLICILVLRYKRLKESSIRKIFDYLHPKRRRPNRQDLTFLLSDRKVDETIVYCS